MNKVYVGRCLQLLPALWKALVGEEKERETAIEEAHQQLKTLENELEE